MPDLMLFFQPVSGYFPYVLLYSLVIFANNVLKTCCIATFYLLPLHLS